MIEISIFLTLALALQPTVIGSVPVQGRMAGGGQMNTQQEIQGAADSFVFIISAPQNCLMSISDLPNSVSKNMAALWIRAAFHNFGTFSAPDLGGSASLISFLNETENKGLSDSIATKFQQNTAVNMSKSDMIALAGQVSISHCGGPSMKFRGGRTDTAKPVSPFGIIPTSNSTLASYRPRLAAMGWTDYDIVSLITGSHSMGGVHGVNSPSVTNQSYIPFDDTPGIFDNHVFKYSLQGQCAAPIDCDIANDASLRPIVALFANNQTAFFEQYALSYQKLVAQTAGPLNDPIEITVPAHQGLLTTPQPPLNFQMAPEISQVTSGSIHFSFPFHLISFLWGIQFYQHIMAY